MARWIWSRWCHRLSCQLSHPIAYPLLAVLSFCGSAPSPKTIRCDQARSSSHPMYQSSKTHLRNNLVDMLFTLELKSILAASSAPDHLRGWLWKQGNWKVLKTLRVPANVEKKVNPTLSMSSPWLSARSEKVSTAPRFGLRMTRKQTYARVPFINRKSLLWTSMSESICKATVQPKH